jgi:hypothetical protein
MKGNLTTSGGCELLRHTEGRSHDIYGARGGAKLEVMCHLHYRARCGERPATILRPTPRRHKCRGYAPILDANKRRQASPYSDEPGRLLWT